MAHVLDLNLYEQPTLELTMRDAEHTKIRVNIPDTDLVTELKAKEDRMRDLLTKGDVEGVAAAYDLVARIISYNEDGIAVTPDDLKNRYRINLYCLMGIYRAYLDFIHDIEKN